MNDLLHSLIPNPYSLFPHPMSRLFNSLGSRLIITHILVAITVLIVVGVALLATVPPLQRALTLRHLAASRQASLLLSRQVVKLAQNDNTAQRQRLWQALQEQAQAQDIRILLINPTTQKITFDTANRLTGTTWQESLAVEPQPLRWWRLLPGNRVVRNQTLRGSIRLEGTSWLYVAGPLPPGREADARFLVVMRPPSSLWNALRTLTEEVPPLLLASVLLILLAIIYLLSAWVASSVTRNLMPVILGTQQVAAGKLDYRVPTDQASLREVALLARSFNRMAERVQQSQQAQRDFIANVSHDLKTPLTSIQGFAQALLDGTATTPTAQARATEIIHNEAQRLGKLVNELLAALNLDSGQLQLNRQPLDLNPQLADLLRAYRTRSESSGIHLTWQLAASPLMINADPDYLQRAFINLLDNAFTHTPSGGRITVRTTSITASTPAERFAEVEIIDTGKGIPSSDLPYIFDRFYQVDKSRSGQRGFGLGLSIVRGIVEAHNGAVGVDSQPGTGSRFWVQLPLVNNE